LAIDLWRAAHQGALFCSQYLHCMADLLDRWRSGELECEIPLIVSNHRDVERLAGFYGYHLSMFL